MKQIVWLLVALASITMLDACKEKKKLKDTADYAEVYEIPRPKDPIAMVEPEKNISVVWQGDDCEVHIVGTAVDSLPKVSNEFGQMYKDNSYDVKIVKADGSVAFHRTFVKSMFLPKITNEGIRSEYASKAILRDVAVELNPETSELLFFTVCLQEPEAVDDYAVVFKYCTNGFCEQLEIDERDDLNNRDREQM